jgi:hypothetical protein
VVLRMEEEKGIRAAKFFLNSKEIVLSEALPTEVRIEVILGHVEAVSEVWVTYTLGQGGRGGGLPGDGGQEIQGWSPEC